MARFFSIGSGIVLLTYGCWRTVAALLARWQELVDTGELARRRARRRSRAIDRELVRAGLGSSDTPRARSRARVRESVHVGRVGAGDVDDVGLLEAAMRRAGSVRRSGADAPDPAAPQPAAAVEQVPRIAIVLAVTGVGVTCVPLVRPLGDGSPWLAIGGLALAFAGWLAARRG